MPDGRKVRVRTQIANSRGTVNYSEAVLRVEPATETRGTRENITKGWISRTSGPGLVLEQSGPQSTRRSPRADTVFARRYVSHIFVFDRLVAANCYGPALGLIHETVVY